MILVTVCWFLLWFIGMLLSTTGGVKLIANKSMGSARCLIASLHVDANIVDSAL